MKALFAKVGNIKAFPSSGVCRVEIEVPYEAFAQIVSALHEQQVLVTIAPPMDGPYGIRNGGSEERVVEPRKPEVPASHESHLGARAKWAVLRCKDEDFRDWLTATFNDLWVEERARCETAEEAAKWVICKICDIASRRELDTNTEAGARFDRMIRVPFARALR